MDPNYPALVCQRCYRLQGWLAEGGEGEGETIEPVSHDGWCDYCLYAVQVRDLGRTAMGILEWKERGRYYAAAGRYDKAAQQEYRHVRRGPGLWRRLRFLGRRRRYELERLSAWGKVVHDLRDDWGPAAPDVGFCAWVPERFELVSCDGSELLLHFWAVRYRWQGRRWQRLGAKLLQEDLRNPTVFSASLDAQELASAWHDFRLAVAAINSADWQEHLTVERKASERAARKREQQERVASQRGAAQLLDH